VLPPEHATELLGQIVGLDRVARGPEAAATMVGMCGNLPLALRIVGARLAAKPHWRLQRLTDRLGAEQLRLDELAAGDLEVRASVALSYRGLGVVERRAFRLLGLLHVPDVAPWMLSALLNVPAVEADDIAERVERDSDVFLRLAGHVTDCGCLGRPVDGWDGDRPPVAVAGDMGLVCAHRTSPARDDGEPASLRPPALLVTAVTTVDVLTGGRAWLGIGAGYHREEAQALGLPLPPASERFERLEEDTADRDPDVGRRRCPVRGPVLPAGASPEQPH
jgi:Luciferase-like monooxygenase